MKTPCHGFPIPFSHVHSVTVPEGSIQVATATAVAETTVRRTFKAFEYRDFRLMWVGACTSSVGTWMQIVAQGWLIYKLSHSARLLGLNEFLGGFPILLFSLIGGVVADRVERRRILLASQYIQLVSAGTLTFLVATGTIHVWQILCLSLMSGFAQAFGGPAYSALIPTLVDRDDMPNAIALNSIQFNLAVAVGPALGGLTYARLGAAWCFGLNTISFIAPIIALTMITSRFLPQKTNDSMMSSFLEGIQFVHKQSAMKALIFLAFAMTFLSMPFRTFFPVFVTDIFHRGPETLGWLSSFMGIGSICGSLLIASLGNFRHKGRVAVLMMICLGATISAFALSRFLPLSYAIVLLAGFAMMTVFATVTSLVQLIVADSMRGRVMSVYNAAFRGGMPMGNLVSGWLVPPFTAPQVLAVNGLLLALLASSFFVARSKVTAL